jgi:hypothetical protein
MAAKAMATVPPDSSRAPVEGRVPTTSALPKPLRIAFIVLGIVVVSLTVGGGVLYVRSPRVRIAVSALRELVVAGMQGMHAPGTEALRDAGCKTALVMDTRAVLDTLGALDERGDRRRTMPKLFDGPLVQCAIARGDAALSCERVAEVYVGAVPSPPATFTVMVTVAGQKGAACTGKFDSDGRRVPDGPTAPPTPPAGDVPREVPTPAASTR